MAMWTHDCQQRDMAFELGGDALGSQPEPGLAGQLAPTLQGAPPPITTTCGTRLYSIHVYTWHNVPLHLARSDAADKTV